MAPSADRDTANSTDLRARQLELVTHEYAFVSGLIPFYRGVEMRALAGTGLVLSGVAAAFAALESANTPHRHAEALLLSIAAWVPALLVLVEIMALTRLRRASLYIAQHLHPLACELGGGDGRLLRWELEPSHALVEETVRRDLPGRPGRAAKRLVTERTMLLFASSTPLILLIALTAIGLAIAGWVIRPSLESVLVGGPAAIAALVFAAYGVAFTQLHESRRAIAADTPAAGLPLARE